MVETLVKTPSEVHRNHPFSFEKIMPDGTRETVDTGGTVIKVRLTSKDDPMYSDTIILFDFDGDSTIDGFTYKDSSNLLVTEDLFLGIKTNYSLGLFSRNMEVRKTRVKFRPLTPGDFGH